VEMAGRIAMVADPGGAPFYVMTPKPPPDAPDGKSTAFEPEINCGHCGWNELMAADAAREIGFYVGLFGWSLPEPMDMGPMDKYQFVVHDDVTIGAIMGTMPEAPEPHWNHYFWTKSIAAAKDKIEAHGGRVINGPMEVPGGGWIVQGIDPQGAMFSLVGAK
jgi:predicted enzyme related to lactoylglutathione lyase